jgi:hypothetical protein
MDILQGLFEAQFKNQRVWFIVIFVYLKRNKNQRHIDFLISLTSR